MGEDAGEAACSAGMQGLIGTWGAGKGKKDSNHRSGRWMPAGVDACKGGHAIQDLKRRGGNWVHKDWCISVSGWRIWGV